MVFQEILLSILYLGAHLPQILKEKIREAWVIDWFLVGEMFELMEKPQMINIHNTHSSLIGHMFDYVICHF